MNERGGGALHTLSPKTFPRGMHPWVRLKDRAAVLHMS